MITIRFVAHSGLFHWAVKKAQYGFWASHCEAVLPDGRLLGAHVGGVQILPADYDEGQFLRQRYVSLNATAEQEDKFFSFLHAQIGKPYDFLAIAAFASGRNWHEPDSWFCDELQTAAFAECGIFPQHLVFGFNRITIRDLFLLMGMIAER